PLVVLVRPRRVQIGRPARHAVGSREVLELVRVAADKDRIGHYAAAVSQADAAFGTNGADRTDEMLVGTHPAGDAVHDDPESNRIHCRSPENWIRLFCRLTSRPPRRCREARASPSRAALPKRSQAPRARKYRQDRRE